jgi:predicted MPP superfamily phosphohydrolase
LPVAVLQEAIAITNQEKPDLIFLTGDFITDSPQPIFTLVDSIKALESQGGIYACLGNHDSYLPNARETVKSALTSVGIRVLWNEIVTPYGENFPIVGLADYWSGEFLPQILEQISPDIPRLVLSHNPDTAMILKDWRVDLQLSGQYPRRPSDYPRYRFPTDSFQRKLTAIATRTLSSMGSLSSAV